MKQLSVEEREELRKQLSEYHTSKAKEVARDSDQSGGFFGPEKAGIQKGVLGGIIMMAIAGIWFFGGLAVGIVFFYPPILFLIGVFASLRGIATGNLAGKQDRK